MKGKKKGGKRMRERENNMDGGEHDIYSHLHRTTQVLGKDFHGKTLDTPKPSLFQP